jgi:hypothetical protein
LLAWPTRLRFELNTINQSLDNTSTNHYMPSVSEPNNVVSIADWKAKHQRNHDQPQSMSLCVILMGAGGSNWLATLNSIST